MTSIFIILILLLILLIILFSVKLYRYYVNSDDETDNIENLKNETYEIMKKFEDIISSPTIKKNIKINYPILYINLDRSLDRKNMMENQFKKNDIKNYKRISAVDGKNINKFGDDIQSFNFINTFNDNSTGSEIGCTLSHIKAIKYAYDNDLGTVLILEDDVSLDLLPLWKYSLEELEAISPNDWKILQLYNGLCNIDQNSFYTNQNLCYGTVVYLINRKGQEKIMELFNHEVVLILSPNKYKNLTNVSADIFLYTYIENWYAINMPLFTTINNLDELDSTIHPEHTIRHISRNNDIISAYMNIDEENILENVRFIKQDKIAKIKTRNVFIYWTGKDYKLINILRNIIFLYSTKGDGYNVIFLTPENIDKYITHIPSYFYELLPAHQADYIRVNVICDYGGIWIDSDTLILDSLDSLFGIIECKNGFFIKENNKIVWNGIFGSKPNTSFMKKWKSDILDILQNVKNKKKMEWALIGCDYLTKNQSSLNNYFIFDGLDNLYPVNWDKCVEEYIEKPYDNYQNIIRKFQPLIVLVNSVYKNLETKSISEIFNDKIPLNYFLLKAYDNMHHLNNIEYKEINGEKYVKNQSITEIFYKIRKIRFLEIDKTIYTSPILLDLVNYIKFLPSSFYPDKILIKNTNIMNEIKSILDEYKDIGYTITRDEFGNIILKYLN